MMRGAVTKHVSHMGRSATAARGNQRMGARPHGHTFPRSQSTHQITTAVVQTTRHIHRHDRAQQPPAAGSPALPPPRPTLQYDYPGSVKVDLHSRRALRPLHRPRAHLRWDSLSRASLVPKQGDDAERGGGLEARSHSPPDQKMLMYWPMRLRWSCEMHSAIQTMLRISCSLIFTYA